MLGGLMHRDGCLGDQRGMRVIRHPVRLLGVLALAASWAAAGLAADTVVFGPETYTRRAGKPVKFRKQFTVQKPSGRYVMRVANRGVTSAVITLNGRTVFDPDDFTNERRAGRDDDRDRGREGDDNDRDRDRQDRDRGGDDQQEYRGRAVQSLARRVALRAGKNEVVVQLRSWPGTSLTVEIVQQGGASDTTPPTITAAADPPANAIGWNNKPVTVTFTCADTESGIATCPAPVTISADGANQTVSGTASDNAGNTATASLAVSVDKTAPTVTATVSRAPNPNGWNNTPVLVTFAASDATSGVAAGSLSAPVPLSADGTNLSALGQATDLAGNVGSVTRAGINIDTTPPVITVDLTPAAGGWVSTAVTARFTCSDDGSGVDACPLDQRIATEGAAQTVTASVLDRAGNSGTVVSAPIDIDFGPPVITVTLSPEPNARGWNHTPVTARFTCTDGTAGVAICPSDELFTTDGDAQDVTGTAVDLAGNEGTATATIKIDTTPPTISLSSPAEGSVLFSASAAATGTIADDLSGVAGATCNGAPAVLNGGSFTCAVTLAPGPGSLAASVSDVAGNTSTATLDLTYRRVPVVTITSPANLSFLNISPTTVSGTVDDPDATVTINSIPAPVGGSFSIALPVAEGPNVITATAVTPTGGVGTASLEVTLDTTPPHVTVTSPPDGFVTQEAVISIAGNVNDIVVGTVNDQQAQVKVNGTPAQVANRTFLATAVPLNEGRNDIEVVGTDRVGNAATTRITVVRRTLSQAQIRLLSGNNQSAPIGSVLSTPLVVGLVDAFGLPAPNTPVIFTVKQNDGLLAADAATAATVIVTTDDRGEARTHWTLGTRAGAGGNVAEVYAVGFEGTAIFTATGTQGAPGTIVIDSGNGQLGSVGQPLPRPFVAVVVDAGNNRLEGVPVTFTAARGGGTFDGAPAVGVFTDPDGRAAATLTLGALEGNSNNLVEATFPSNTGFPASFTASARIPGDPAMTRISGVVLDNSDVPIPGVIVRAVLTNELHSNAAAVQSAVAALTNEHGQFSIDAAPVGLVKILVDGSTAQLPGVYPALEYDIVTVAGQDNTIGAPIYLLPLNMENRLCVTETNGGGTLTLPEAPGFSLTFGPGQVTFAGGSKSGCIGVTVVHGDKVPMVPAFGQQPRFIVTIQPPGAHFNPPAAVTLPNVDGLKPREIAEMFSYDHDIGAFVSIGTGTVSADGQVIKSDPGVGVLKSGWFEGTNPNPTGNADSPPPPPGPSVTLRGDAAKSTPGRSVKLTASGSPTKGAAYAWALIDDPSDPDDDVTVANFASAPTCPGQGSCDAQLRGNKLGTASALVSFQTENGGATSNIVKVKFDVTMKVTEVSFIDDIENLYRDEKGKTSKVDDPVWKSSNKSSQNNPVAYVSRDRMNVTVKFTVSPAPTVRVSNLTIEGEIPGFGKFKKTGLTIEAGDPTPEFKDIFAEPRLPEATKYFESMTINWRHMIDGKDCPSCTQDGRSSHKVYVTLDTPKQEKVYLTTLHLAVSKDGASDKGTAAANSWSLFTGLNLTTWDGRSLYYYRSDVGFNGCARDEVSLLTAENGSGQCGSFAHLLMSVFAINGISSQWVNVCAIDGLQFLVRKWDRIDPTFPDAPEYKWSMQFNLGDPMVPDREKNPRVQNGYGDLKNTPDLKGQHSAPPSEKLFIRHFIVKMTDVQMTESSTYYYDPSYGVTYSGTTPDAAATSFEANAVEGYVRQFADDSRLPGVFRLRNVAGRRNIMFDEGDACLK